MNEPTNWNFYFKVFKTAAIILGILGGISGGIAFMLNEKLKSLKNQDIGKIQSKVSVLEESLKTPSVIIGNKFKANSLGFTIHRSRLQSIWNSLPKNKHILQGVEYGKKSYEGDFYVDLPRKSLPKIFQQFIKEFVWIKIRITEKKGNDIFNMNEILSFDFANPQSSEVFLSVLYSPETGFGDFVINVESDLIQSKNETKISGNVSMNDICDKHAFIQIASNKTNPVTKSYDMGLSFLYFNDDKLNKFFFVPEGKQELIVTPPKMKQQLRNKIIVTSGTINCGDIYEIPPRIKKHGF